MATEEFLPLTNCRISLDFGGTYGPFVDFSQVEEQPHIRVLEVVTTIGLGVNFQHSNTHSGPNEWSKKRGFYRDLP